MCIPTESIELVYLDPPFNSNRNCNVLFKDESGIDSEAQFTAFEDTQQKMLDVHKRVNNQNK